MSRCASLKTPLNTKASWQGLDESSRRLYLKLDSPFQIASPDGRTQPINREGQNPGIARKKTALVQAGATTRSHEARRKVLLEKTRQQSMLPRMWAKNPTTGIPIDIISITTVLWAKTSTATEVLDSIKDSTACIQKPI